MTVPRHRSSRAGSGGSAAGVLDATRLLGLLDGHSSSPRWPAGGLAECVRCHRRLVVPVRYEEQDGQSWWIRLRCGACGFARELVASDEDVQDLTDELEAAREEILIALERLRLGRVPDEVAALEQALAHAASPLSISGDTSAGGPGALLVLRRIAVVVGAGVALLVLLLVML